MMHRDFYSWMEREWVCEEGLMQSLKKFSKKLKSWNMDVFGGIFRRKRRIRSRLEGVKRELDVKATTGLLKLEMGLKRERSEVLQQKEVLWM